MHRLKPQPTGKRNLDTKLAEIARIGALFLDGDALEDVFASGQDWTSGDDINFAHGPFIEVKRTVLKIERIPDFRCFAMAMLVRKDDPTKIEPVVCGMRAELGRAPLKMTPPMRRCLKKDEVTTEKKEATGDVFAYAPVKNSDAEPVGILAVHTALRG